MYRRRIIEGRAILNGVGVDERPRSTTCSRRCGNYRAIEPCLAIEIGDVHHERVPFPSSSRVAQPESDQALGMLGAVRVNRAHRVTELEDERQVPGTLENLKWFGRIDSSRSARVKHFERGSAAARASKFFCRCCTASGRYGMN